MTREIDRIGNAIDYDHVAFVRHIKFCPRCGTGNLQRHERIRVNGKPVQGVELWCLLCGFSFNIRTSVEWNLALRIFKEHRQMRTLPRCEEKWVDPAVVALYKQTQKSKSGTFSLGDKLKAALGF